MLRRRVGSARPCLRASRTRRRMRRMPRHRLGTGSAQLGRERATAAHRTDSRGARVRTIAVEANARAHHGDVLLVQAGVRTHLARHQARDARLDAVVILRTVAAKVGPQFDAGHRCTPEKVFLRPINKCAIGHGNDGMRACVGSPRVQRRYDEQKPYLLAAHRAHHRLMHRSKALNAGLVRRHLRECDAYPAPRDCETRHRGTGDPGRAAASRLVLPPRLRERRTPEASSACPRNGRATTTGRSPRRPRARAE